MNVKSRAVFFGVSLIGSSLAKLESALLASRCLIWNASATWQRPPQERDPKGKKKRKDPNAEVTSFISDHFLNQRKRENQQQNQRSGWFAFQVELDWYTVVKRPGGVPWWSTDRIEMVYGKT